MIRILKTKDLSNFLQFCSQQDNEKISDLQVAKKIFNKCLKHGDKCLVYEDFGEIKGILMIVGFADKSIRKDLKIFSNSEIIVSDLMRSLNWYYNCNLYIEIKKQNPIAEILLGTRNYNSCFRKNLNRNRYKGFGFKFKSSTENEVLLLRTYDPKFKYKK